jgi:methanogenic corrinoid protein MtbC1
MILWCAYCQQYQGEVLPFDSFEVSHVLCKDCEARGGIEAFGDAQANVLRLAEFQKKLWHAGKVQDVEAAITLIEEARTRNIRPVDTLIGLVSPLLFEIGTLWELGKITVEDEHRFTRFYESVITKVETDVIDANGTEILLLAPKGNFHFLGIRVLNLWLRENGVHSRVLQHPEDSELITFLLKHKPRSLGFSVSLPEQVTEVLRLAELIRKTLLNDCPRFILGGGAVRRGTVTTVDGMKLLTDGTQIIS